MSQSPVPPVPGPPRPAPPASSEPGSTRAPSADVVEVLDTLEQLDTMPVGDHVAVFEQAHASLRRALDEAGAGRPAGA